ncbi:hypothetical protein [Oceanicella sp. SM1341]|uniref:hypothetical protein n=1 Tax=Oceanicella sp. SM1341 TaxID=1548889 RepID=UPI000E4CF9C7|nr:hypothetical protein [Oceanicella sp. SM1341]
MPANDTLRVHVPLTVRKRGGRPRILPPRDIEASDPPPGQHPPVLRAISRAWAWRQRMERGEVTTIADLAAEEGLSDRYVSRLLRLAWLAPNVLERLVVRREPCVIRLFELCFVACLPWDEQLVRVFD